MDAAAGDGGLTFDSSFGGLSIDPTFGGMAVDDFGGPGSSNGNGFNMGQNGAGGMDAGFGGSTLTMDAGFGGNIMAMDAGGYGGSNGNTDTGFSGFGGLGTHDPSVSDSGFGSAAAGGTPWRPMHAMNSHNIGFADTTPTGNDAVSGFFSGSFSGGGELACVPLPLLRYARFSHTWRCQYLRL